MDKIKNKYELVCGGHNSVDIFEHLPTLYKYAMECDSVFETGVRGCISSWAFLYGLLNNNNGVHKKLFLNDIDECNIYELLYLANRFDNISVKYEWKNNLLLDLNQNYDITFIDTWHVYAQLKRELAKFSKTTNKYIIMHDTTVDEIHGETIRQGWNAEKQSQESGFPIEEIKKGLWPAVEEFLLNNPEWYLKERFTNNNGLTILARKEHAYKYYSQCQEDIYLNETIFKNKVNGTYIELGALDGILYSNTKFFEDFLNWKGILIEPHPEKFKQLEKNRPNNFLFNNLISCHTEPLEFKYFVDIHAAVSGVENTLPQFHFEHFFNENNKSLPQNKILIKPISLTEIVKQTGLKHVDLLSLDVEGHEYEVLKSWDFSIPIDIILIETLGVQPEKEQLCRDILILNNYKFVSKYKHNEIYSLNTYKIS